jgi:hypothetical protein
VGLEKSSGPKLWSKDRAAGCFLFLWQERAGEAARPGVWQVRVSLGRDPATRRYRTIAREVPGGRRDAERVAAKLVMEVGEGTATPARSSVGDLLSRWLEHQSTRGLAPHASRVQRLRQADHL